MLKSNLVFTDGKNGGFWLLKFAGAVQGVGFRPFVFNLAQKAGLSGFVLNDGEGVKCVIFASKAECEAFVKELQENLPPLASLSSLDTVFLGGLEAVKGEFSQVCEDLRWAEHEFRIVKSQNSSKFTTILPDFGICRECEAEFKDPQNRRWRHLFINCTNCGPRFSIITALPYDRQNTTMAEFAMCEACEKEYNDPQNRRYHAQPTACNECGVRARFVALSDEPDAVLAGEEGFLQPQYKVVKTAAAALCAGQIVAVKGVGGFHLMCDATNAEAVERLRSRKKRAFKPFALMAQNAATAAQIAEFNEAETALLTSQIKPIVLGKKRSNSVLTKTFEAVAPKLSEVGVMLPATSLQMALLDELSALKNAPAVVVATSANLSGEPILTEFDEVCATLGGVADAVLDYNRKIANASDDSIVFCAQEGEGFREVWLRTSRGVKPRIFNLKESNSVLTNEAFKVNLQKPNLSFLALGSEMKNTFALYKDGLVFSSPYLGEMKNPPTLRRFARTWQIAAQTYEASAAFAVADLHPHFLLAKEFERARVSVKRVQHHKAHTLSVAYENGVSEPFVALSWDGTGYGEDGSVWGAELFFGDLRGMARLERAAALESFGLLGGDAAVKKPSLSAYSLLRTSGFSAREAVRVMSEKFGEEFDESALEVALKNGVVTSSLGRFIDGVGALCLGVARVEFDAQIPMWLGACFDPAKAVPFCFKTIDGKSVQKEVKAAFSSFLRGGESGFFRIGVSEFVRQFLGSSASVCASSLLRALAGLACEVALGANEAQNGNAISLLLSGGVWQNRVLLQEVLTRLHAEQIRVFTPKFQGSNDENIALGQLFWQLLQKVD